jgi:hypothetical protein
MPLGCERSESRAAAGLPHLLDSRPTVTLLVKPLERDIFTSSGVLGRASDLLVWSAVAVRYGIARTPVRSRCFTGGENEVEIIAEDFL